MNKKIYLVSGIRESVLNQAYNPATKIFDKSKTRMRERETFHAATLEEISFLQPLFQTNHLEVTIDSGIFGPEYYLGAAVDYAVSRSQGTEEKPIILFLHLPECLIDGKEYQVTPTNGGTFYEISPAILTIDSLLRVKQFKREGTRISGFELDFLQT